MKWDVIVVGGGASGLMAAGRAAELGARVLLLEKMGRAGIKLGLTGKGRCNLTNAGDLPSFIERYRHNGKFLYNAFSRFFHEDLIAFFNARGLPTVEERGRRIFPRSNRAEDVVRVLQQYALGNGVRLKLRVRVRDILAPEQRVQGVITDRGPFEADRVVLATGGASYPETGSSGDGYEMAKRLGHTICPIRPSLVPLKVKESWVRDLQGLSLKNVRVRILKDGATVGEEFGEMLFTHFGVSGPIILSLSGFAVERMKRERLELTIDFKREPKIRPHDSFPFPSSEDHSDLSLPCRNLCRFARGRDAHPGAKRLGGSIEGFPADPARIQASGGGDCDRRRHFRQRDQSPRHGIQNHPGPLLLRRSHRCGWDERRI
jgi:predicted Rossmann fold flavoprotein